MPIRMHRMASVATESLQGVTQAPKRSFVQMVRTGLAPCKENLLAPIKIVLLATPPIRCQVYPGACVS